jgi:hypothetical protein
MKHRAQSNGRAQPQIDMDAIGGHLCDRVRLLRKKKG